MAYHIDIKMILLRNDERIDEVGTMDLSTNTIVCIFCCWLSSYVIDLLIKT